MLARDNPFRVERVMSARYRFLDTNWAACLEHLADLSYRAAITGPHGSGKTTLLEDIGSHLRESGTPVKSLFLNEDRPVDRVQVARLLGSLCADDVVLVDGADLLGRFAWLHFKRACGKARGLIIAAHREGMLPTLIRCRTTPELLSGIVADLLGRRDEQVEACLPGLFREHRGNLRDVIRALYDEYAGINRMREPGLCGGIAHG